MRISRSRPLLAARLLMARGRPMPGLLAPSLLSGLLLGSLAIAQEPAPTPAATPAPTPGEAPAETPAGAPAEARPGRNRARRQVVVIEAGTVHPVAGPSIENGVVVVRGERIVAVGKQGEVQVPPNAVVRSFPDGHAYPGLVDASTDAFTDATLRLDASLDGGATFADDLRLRYSRDDELVQAGITTAYVTVRSPSLVRGQGAIVRPVGQGFELWNGHEHAGLELRMTDGPVPSHALQRLQQLQAADALFEGLDEFRKAQTDHEEALTKYQKEFEEYLAWHKKKKDGEKPATEPETPAKPAGDAPATPPAGERQGRRGNRGGNGPPRERPKEPGPGGELRTGEEPLSEAERELAAALAALGQDPPPSPPQGPGSGRRFPSRGGAPAPQGPAAETKPGEEKKDDGPKRPTYPKPLARDPQKEALLRVLDGDLPLRVEAHRADELRAALRMQTARSIPLLVLEQAYGADALADAIARQGASVVLTDVLPSRMPKPYEDFDVVALPARLQAAGVPFAIASGSARRASLLPLMAAAAVGRGLDREIALRAITLTPAEILGVDKDTGSLEPGKFADLLVSDRPLFATDSRVLLVLAKGRTEFEAK